MEAPDSPKLPYPKSSFFILAAYFLERFTYYGLFGGVVLYMQRILKFSAPASSTLKAVTEGLIYLAPVVGAVIADTYLGKVRMIFTMCCIYIIGAFVFSLSSIPTLLPTTLGAQFVGILGMLIFGISTGLMKAVYSSLGPDQFKVPEQRREQQRFFCAFYWMINAGAFLGTILTAQLRSSVQCFGNDCFVLPFAILCCVMILSTLVFYCGKSRYTEVPPDDTLLKSIKCIFYACKKSITNRKTPVGHWIERSREIYEEPLIEDIKRTLGVLVHFITFPLFWALFYQTSTGMIFQAKRLNGYIGSYKIPPEITSSVNPMLILILIPLCEFVIYPLLEKKSSFKDSRTKMALGMILACIAFIFYGIVNSTVEQAILGEKYAQLNIYNADNCTLHVSSNWIPKSIAINPRTEYKLSSFGISNKNVTFKTDFICGEFSDELDVNFLEMHETTVIMLQGGVKRLAPTKHYLKDEDAESKIRVITDHEIDSDQKESFPTLVYGNQIEHFQFDNKVSQFKPISPKIYSIIQNNKTVGIADIRQDGVYDIILSNEKSVVFHMTKPSNTHMLWLLPQYVLITAGEVLFSVSAMDFAYAEVPTSMKAMMQAVNLFTITIGLWLFAFITKLNTATRMFQYRASYEAFTYSIAMALNTLVFILIVRYYIKKEKKGEVAMKEIK